MLKLAHVMYDMLYYFVLCPIVRNHHILLLQLIQAFKFMDLPLKLTFFHAWHTWNRTSICVSQYIAVFSLKTDCSGHSIKSTLDHETIQRSVVFCMTAFAFTSLHPVFCLFPLIWFEAVYKFTNQNNTKKYTQSSFTWIRHVLIYIKLWNPRSSSLVWDFSMLVDPLVPLVRVKQGMNAAAYSDTWDESLLPTLWQQFMETVSCLDMTKPLPKKSGP